MEPLRLTKPRMHGPCVVRLQEIGNYLGVDYGNIDGIFGPRTQQVVKDLQMMLGMRPNGICDEITWAAVVKLADSKIRFDCSRDIVDRIGQHPNPRLYAHERTWKEIDGVTLHQTGCKMPCCSQSWDHLNAHIGITCEGKVILVNDPTAMIWHAQGLSRSTIGIEIAGNFEGIEGNKKTLWKGGGGPHKLTEEMLKGLETLFNWLALQFAANHRPFAHVYAHRQSAQSRIGDPGSEIWQKAAVPWMMRLNADSGGAGFFTGQGRPIPREWDNSSANGYFDLPTIVVD